MDIAEVRKTKPQIKIVTPGPQGPPGPSGEVNSATVVQIVNDYLIDHTPAPGPGGGSGTAFFRHYQAIPTAIWHIVHNLGYHPAVTITDSAGGLVEGSVKYINDNELEVSFSSAFGGEADLS